MSCRWQYGHPLYPILSTLLPTRRGKTRDALAIEANLAPGIVVRQLCALAHSELSDFCAFFRRWQLESKPRGLEFFCIIQRNRYDCCNECDLRVRFES
jgi:hypothetical protein